MVKIVLTPDWFIGKDVLIEAFSLIVLIVVVILAIRNYLSNRNNRNLLYLSLGFTLIALAQLAVVFTKLVLYYDIGPSQIIGEAIVTSQILSSVDIFYYLGFFFERFFTLCGLYIIYRLPRKKKSVADYAFIAYFIIISSILNERFFYLFHLTAFVLLIMIVEKYYEVYKENKFINTKILMWAFGILAFSQLIFTLSEVDVLFAFANITELISYAILLGIVIRILKHGKEKKPYGYNIRYAGNNSGKKREH